MCHVLKCLGGDRGRLQKTKWELGKAGAEKKKSSSRKTPILKSDGKKIKRMKRKFQPISDEWEDKTGNLNPQIFQSMSSVLPSLLLIVEYLIKFPPHYLSKINIRKVLGTGTTW